jgi:hypothetical protein
VAEITDASASLIPDCRPLTLVARNRQQDCRSSASGRGNDDRPLVVIESFTFQDD